LPRVLFDWLKGIPPPLIAGSISASVIGLFLKSKERN
jgi:hypothetical protein